MDDDKMEKGNSLYGGAGSEFDESEHPRDNDGKFAEKDNDGVIRRNLASDISTLLGTEYKGYKGQKAIGKLMQEKQGYIKGAFHREDIGDIDLLWGNDNFGLQHILMRRTEQGIDTGSFVKDITDVVEMGMFYQKSERGNFEFWKSGKMVVIAPEYHGNKITYLLTAYKRTKIKAP